MVLQPLPASFHTTSLQPRDDEVLFVNVVPPTAMTVGADAGNETPGPVPVSS